jgi:RNA 3'-terminal phosphate cyclase (ATP)
MLTIDGAYGEGGGQVLRTALALATLTGRPFRIEHIRARRENPGLRPQHLTAVWAAAAVCEGRLEGDELGSQVLAFVPDGPPRAGEYTFDVADAARAGSAGSVALILQTVLLPLGRAEGDSRVTLRGGTHVPWAPPVPYLEHVFLPVLAQLGVRAEIELSRWGFYPAGGGEIQVSILGQKGPLSPVTLTERGDLQRVWGVAAVMNLPSHIPQRMAARARNVLAEAGLQAEIKPMRLRGAGPGAGIFLFAQYANVTTGFTAFGRKGLPAEHVAEAACEELVGHHRSGAPADAHLADQLVLAMSLAQGSSQVVTSLVSQHLLTNAWVVQQFLSRDVRVEGTPGGLGRVVIV